jgi:hypothetical protein
VLTATLQNTLILRKDVCSRNIPIKEFKDEVTMKWLHVHKSTASVTASSAMCCVLVNMESARRWCGACYEVMKSEYGQHDTLHICKHRVHPSISGIRCMATERLHRSVFYYENNEYLKNLPKDSIAPAHSHCCSPPCAARPHIQIVPGSPPSASYHKQSGFHTTHM